MLGILRRQLDAADVGAFAASQQAEGRGVVSGRLPSSRAGEHFLELFIRDVVCHCVDLMRLLSVREEILGRLRGTTSVRAGSR